MWDQPAVECQTEEPPNGLTTAVPVIESPVIHVHSHEFIRKRTLHVAGERERMVNGFGAMIKAEPDACSQDPGNLFTNFGWKLFVNDIPSQWQWQTVVP